MAWWQATAAAGPRASDLLDRRDSSAAQTVVCGTGATHRREAARVQIARRGQRPGMQCTVEFVRAGAAPSDDGTNDEGGASATEFVSEEEEPGSGSASGTSDSSGSTGTSEESLVHDGGFYKQRYEDVPTYKSTEAEAASSGRRLGLRWATQRQATPRRDGVGPATRTASGSQVIDEVEADNGVSVSQRGRVRKRTRRE